MALDNVLSRLEANENRFINLSNQYGQDALRITEGEVESELGALTEFSTTLADHLVWRKKKENERLEKEGRVAVIEEDIAKEEQEAGSSVSKDERDEYEIALDTLKKSKKAFDNAAVTAQDNGATFEESEQIKNFSGWKLYGATMQRAELAGDSYKAWMEGEMANNDNIQINYQGDEFTPSTAKTLAQKRVAMTALRRQYLDERGLLGVHKVLLADHFYKKALPAHSELMAQFEKQDAIETSFLKEEDAIREFTADRDFGSLISSLAPLWDKKGSKYGYRGALEKGVEVLKDLFDAGSITEEEFEEMKNQTTTVDGREVVVGKYWKTRFDLLEEDLQKQANDNVQLELDTQATKGKEIKRDFRNWVKERKKNKEAIREVHLEEWAKIYEAATGDKAPDFITDFKSKEDRDDEQDIKDLKKLRQKRKYLLEADLTHVSEDVYQQMIGFVIEDKPLAQIPKRYTTAAESKIRAWSTTAVDLSEGQRDTKEFVEGYFNALDDYHALIAEYIRVGENQRSAQKLALQDVEDSFQLDKGKDAPLFSKYWTSNKTSKSKLPPGYYWDEESGSVRYGKNKAQSRHIHSAIKTIQSYGSRKNALNSLSETLLDGSDTYLSDGMKYKEGKIDDVPYFYRRIAEDFDELSGWDILDAQLKASGVKEGLGDRPLILETLDDPLLKDLKRKLNKLTTSQQISQAKYDVLDMEYWIGSSVYNHNPSLLTPGLITT